MCEHVCMSERQSEREELCNGESLSLLNSTSENILHLYNVDSPLTNKPFTKEQL